jgi:hypothetical protein
VAIITSRRSFITGLVALVAAPAIVRAGSLMPVKVLEPSLSVEELLRLRMEEAYRITRENLSNSLYGDLTSATRRAFVPRSFVDIYRADNMLEALMNHTKATVCFEPGTAEASPWQLTRRSS